MRSSRAAYRRCTRTASPAGSSTCGSTVSSPDDGNVPLTNAEFNLLAAFLAAPQRVLSRDQLLGMSRLHDETASPSAISAPRPGEPPGDDHDAAGEVEELLNLHRAVL